MLVDESVLVEAKPDDAMQVSASSSPLPANGTTVSAPVTMLDRQDLDTLVGFFYLPFEKGRLAAQVLADFAWLKANARQVVS